MILPKHLEAHYKTVNHLFKLGCSIESAIHWVIENYELNEKNKNILYLKHYRDELDYISSSVKEYEELVEKT